MSNLIILEKLDPEQVNDDLLRKSPIGAAALWLGKDDVLRLRDQKGSDKVLGAFETESTPEPKPEGELQEEPEEEPEDEPKAEDEDKPAEGKKK